MSVRFRARHALLALVILLASDCGAPPNLIGEPCSSSASCGGLEFCETARHGGECSALCEENDSVADCGAGNVCAALPAGSWECRKGCTSDSQCRTGYTCTGSQGSLKFCVGT